MSDLFYGLTPYHIRLLTDDPWSKGGGMGKSLKEIGTWTLDQVFFMLCDRENLRRSGRDRVRSMESLSALSILTPDADGMIQGRSSTGEGMRATIRGKSKARELMEAEKERLEREAAAAQPKPSRRRRKKDD